MQVLSTTLCYPNPPSPAQGVFVQRRLREIAKIMPLSVVAPVPWFPGIAPVPFDLRSGECDSPPVRFVRMFYLPGLFKRLDARFFAKALAEAIRDGAGPVDLIDAHFEWPDGVGAFRAARRLGVPFVCTLRGKLVSQIEYPARRRMIREMLVGADALIAVSKSLADLACEVAGRALDVRVIPNGIDGEVFRWQSDRAAARAACGWQADARYVVSVGHLQELKGFHQLVGVWPEVRRRCGDVRLVLVGGSAGEPGYERRLRGQIDALPLEDVVTLAGRVEPARVAAMLNAADLFALASRSEGWCNAIAEALACGCPVVATDVGGNSEIMNDWGLGRLVPYGEPEALTERICVSLEETWDRARIAEYGGRRSWSEVAGECVEVFRSAMEHPR